MTKSELIKKIHSNTDFNYAEIEQITDCVFELISQGLIEDDKILISKEKNQLIEKYLYLQRDGKIDELDSKEKEEFETLKISLK